MKYTKVSDKISDLFINAIFVILLLLVLACLGAFLWMDLYFKIPMISLLWLAMLPGWGFLIKVLIGRITKKDKYISTDLVFSGNSIFDVVKDAKFYTRRMYFCFIECFLFLLLIIRYIFIFPLSVACAIVGIIGAIIGIGICFIFGMSSYEQSDIKNKD